MRGIVSARRRADEFEAGVETGTVSSSAPSETRALVDLVQQIRTIDTVETRADFAADLRTRLLAAAPAFLTLDETASASAPVSVRDRRTTPARRALSAAAAACIVVGGGVGVAAASQTALPGESLYPVKRGIERLEVSTAGSPAGRGQEYLQQADHRLSEIEQLALTRPDDYATPLLMRRALDDFSTAARDGGDSLMTAYREDGSDGSIGDLRQFAEESSRRLDAMMPLLPGDLRDELVAAAESLSTLDSAARRLCPTCSTLGPLDLSSALTIVREPLGQVTGGPVVKPVASPHVTPSGHHKPNAPVTRDAPGTADIPRIPNAPVTANAPGIPNAPVTANAPGIPNAPVPTNAPGIPNAPVTTNAPGIPNAPVTTNAPGIPNAPVPTNAPLTPNASGGPAPDQQGSDLPPATTDPSAIVAVPPSAALPQAPVRPTPPPATQPTTVGTTPDLAALLPRPSAGNNNQPGPSVPSVIVPDPLSTVPEVLDTTGDALHPLADVPVDPSLP